MMYHKKLYLPLLIASLSACGGSSSNTPEVIEEVGTETVISGTATKGTLSNADVTLYKYVDGLPVLLSEAELEGSNVTTNVDGSYSVTILNYTGPVKVVVSVNENTTMICDAPSGCGSSAAFGETMSMATIDPDFTLSAVSEILESTEGDVKVNLSALTHIATSLIESESAIAGETNSTLVQEQSSIIANAFGVTGNLTELEPTKLENTSAVSEEDDSNELNYGLVNAGIMSAMFANESDGTNVLSTKFASIASDLITNDGQFLANQDDDSDFELAITDVLEGASEAANKVSELIDADSTLTPLVSLEQLETNLENLTIVAEENAGEDGLIEKAIDVPTIGGKINKAKAMVDDVRLFANLFNEEKEGNVVAQGDAYLALIDDAGTMIEAEASKFLLLAELGDALSTLAIEYDDGTLTKATPITVSNYITGATSSSSITFDDETSDGGITFDINVENASETVKLNADVAFTDEGNSITITLAGLIDSAAATFTLADDSIIKINLDTPIDRTSLDDDTYEGDITSGDIDLNVSLAQKVSDTITNPITFEGMVKTTLKPVEYNALKTQYRTYLDAVSYAEDYNNNFQPIKKTEILPENLTLSGSFSALTGDEIKATLTANIQDLDSYKAPNLKYVGATVEDLATLNITENISVADNSYDYSFSLVSSDEVKNIESVVQSMNFGSEALDMEMSFTTTFREGETFTEEEFYSSPNFSIKSEPTVVDGVVTTVMITDNYQNSYASFTTTATYTSIDTDSDGTLDSIRSELLTIAIYASTGEEEVLENYTEDNLTELSIEEYLIADGDLISYFLSIKSDVINGVSIIDLMDEFLLDGGMTYTLNNGSTAFVEIDDATFANTNTPDVSLDGYVTEAFIDDVFTINVSDDFSTAVVTNDGGTAEYSSTSTATGWALEISSEFIGYDDSVYTSLTSWESTQIDADTQKYSYRDANQGKDFLVTTVVSESELDGSVTTYQVQEIYSYSLSDTGELLNNAGEVISVDNDADVGTYGNSYDTDNFTAYMGKIYISEDTTLEMINAVDLMKLDLGCSDSDGDWLLASVATTSYSENTLCINGYAYIDDVGEVSFTISSDDIDNLTAGDNSFGGILIEPTDTEAPLEDEDIFLDVNAALSVEITLGEYEVDLTLSGERTGFNDGDFDLDMSYKLPGETLQRSFSVGVNTEEEDTIKASNSEGVVLVMKELDDDANSNVIGTVLVGSSAVQAAVIEDREGIIMVVYSDDTVEAF